MKRSPVAFLRSHYLVVPPVNGAVTWVTPDGYIIEAGQSTQLAIDWFNKHSSFGKQ